MSVSEIQKPKIGLIPAICLIIANMVGTGVFTSLGYQVMGIKSIFALLFLWLLGGIVALSGALTYGELAVRYPRSGGEYNFLSQIYHPALGFLSGWVSATVGFAAPMAAAAMFFGTYFSKVVPMYHEMTYALALIILLTLINISSFKFGSSFQTIFTILNIILILSITTAGVFLSDHSHYHFTLNQNDYESILTSSFAVSLVYVSFAYSGWNSATYIVGEIKDVKINLPKALAFGTTIVILLYLGLNFIFLYSTPIAAIDSLPIERKVEVPLLAATNIFGQEGAFLINLIISIGLVASINSFMIAGPRVTQVIGEDFQFFRIMAKKNKKGSPLFGILFQSTIAIILIVTFTFDDIITYLGLTLSIFATLTVAGVFIVRFKHGKAKGQYNTWGYPITPLLFIALEIWMMVYICIDTGKLKAPIATLSTLLSGLIVYFILKSTQKETYNQNESV